LNNQPAGTGSLINGPYLLFSSKINVSSSTFSSDSLIVDESMILKSKMRSFDDTFVTSLA